MPEEESTIHTKVDFKQALYNIIMMIAKDSGDPDAFSYRVKNLESTLFAYLDQEYRDKKEQIRVQYESDIRGAYDGRTGHQNPGKTSKAEWNAINRTYQELMALARRKNLTPPEVLDEDLGGDAVGV